MITVQKKPTQFAPAGNSVIWQVKSDNTNIVYFKVVLYDENTTTVINQLNQTTRPETPQASYLVLSRMLTNVVRWEVNNDSLEMVVPLQKTVRSYRLKITEMVFNPATGANEAGDVYDTQNERWYVWNAELGRITAHNLVQAKYVINATTVASFLTNKPNFVSVNDYTFEQLYFLQDGTVADLKARVRTFNNSGAILTTDLEAITDLDAFQMYRLNISPKALKDSKNIDFTDVSYYVVDIVDGNMNARTTERVYYYHEAECWLDFVNLVWVNPLGGLDSYQWLAPQDTVNMTKVVMKRNTLGINSDGEYSDFNNGVYNPSDVLISNKPTTTTSVNSRELSDAEAYWLQEMFISKQAFVELTDMALVPILINNDSYTIPRQKYNRGNLNTTSVQFTLADGVIPTGVQAYSTKTSSIEFINSQMNSLGNNLPGYGVTSVVVTQRAYNPDQYGHNYG